MPDATDSQRLLQRFKALLALRGERRSGGRPGSPLRAIAEDARRKGGQLRAPLVSMVDLTSQCNHDCVFCYRSGRAGLMPDGRPRYQSLKRLESICRQLVDTGVASLTLSGGEPTCHPQFLEAVALTRRFDLALTVVTNGTGFSERTARELGAMLEPARDRVELSLNAASAEVFRKVACADRFPALLSTLKWFKRFGLPFVTMTLILRDNLSQIEQIIELAAEHGSSELAVEAPFPKRGLPSDCTASLDEIFDMHERLLRRDRPGPPVMLNFLHLSMHVPGGLQALLGPGGTGGKPSSCHGGAASCAIDIDGELNLCQFLIDLGTCSVGNVFRTPLPDLWADLRSARQEIEGGVPRGCEGGCLGFPVEAGLVEGRGPTAERS